jgi:hypothetical protein
MTSRNVPGIFTDRRKACVGYAEVGRHTVYRLVEGNRARPTAVHANLERRFPQL